MTAWRAPAAFVLIAWGALSFGAVYPWAFTPLYIGCAVVGLLSLLSSRRPAGVDGWLLAALALVALAIAAQLIPLPADWLQRISPETDTVLRQLRLGYPAAVSAHPLSINPPETRVALCATLALGLLLGGLLLGLTRDEAHRLVTLVSVLGVVLAVIAIVQSAMWNGKIYGFWTPIRGGMPFGPFVNRNHFAGWMLMGIPLVFAYFCGRVARGMRGVKPGLRNRVMWLSSAEASDTMLIGFSVLVMAVGLAMSLSRSGVIGLLAAAGITGFVIARRQMSGAGRVVVATFVSLLLLVAIGWTGVERFSSRFSDPDMATLGNRIGVWEDAWRIAQRFPWTGTGLNTFGDATVIYQTTNLELHYNEAHNDYLQLMAEGGALVFIPAVLAAVALVRMIRSRFRVVSLDSSDYWIRVGAVGGILAIGLQSLTEFSLQMPGNAVLFVVLLALAARRTSAGLAAPERRRSADMLASRKG